MLWESKWYALHPDTLHKLFRDYISTHLWNTCGLLQWSDCRKWWRHANWQTLHEYAKFMWNKKNTTLYHFLLNEKMLLLKGGCCFFLRSFLSLISGRRVFLEHLTSFCVDCQRPVDVLTSCCRLYFICCSYFDRRAEKYIQCRNA